MGYSSDNEYSDIELSSDNEYDTFQGFDEEKKIKLQECYKSLSPNEMIDLMNKIISDVSNLLGVKFDVCALLLQFYKWDQPKLLDEFLEDSDKVLEKASINVKDLDYIPNIKYEGFMCIICCNDGKQHGLELACKHMFCLDCFGYYFEQKIKESEVVKITCLGNCGNQVTSSTIGSIVPSNVYKKYQEFLIRHFVFCSKKLEACSFADCPCTIICESGKDDTDISIPVKCSQDHEFCFKCGLENHKPSPCSISERWYKKCQDDSETFNWISANTKGCPKCRSSIEKNGGCNHMHCKKCDFHFCWLCMEDWKVHGYERSCNIYKENKDAEKARSWLQRYFHYYDRYLNHLNSAKLDKKLFEKTEVKIQDIQERLHISWIEAQFLKSAVTDLVNARFALRWSYAFAFYLEKSNFSAIFEQNQSDLEVSVEKLSGFMETEFDDNNYVDLKSNIINLAAYVSSRKKTLIDDVDDGVIEGRWKYLDGK